MVGLWPSTFKVLRVHISMGHSWLLFLPFDLFLSDGSIINPSVGLLRSSFLSAAFEKSHYLSCFWLEYCLKFMAVAFLSSLKITLIIQIDHLHVTIKSPWLFSLQIIKKNFFTASYDATHAHEQIHSAVPL